MKIALVRREFVAGRGGAERYAVALAHGLAERGHEVHVFAGLADSEACRGVRLHTVPFARKPSALKNASFQTNVRSRLSRFPCDIIHGLSQIFPQDVYRVSEPLHLHWLLTRSRSRLLRLVWFCSPRHQVLLWLERNIFMPGNYRRIIVNSDLCRRQAAAYYGVPETKIRLVYNGVETSLFSPADTGRRAAARQRLGIGSNERVLLFIGNDFKRKGILHALQALRRVLDARMPVRLIVAGRGDGRYAARCAAACRVADAVLFVGCVAQPQELYHAADLLLLPARYDPFANVCLEAMACGLPAVTTRSNGASELIRHGVSGFVLENAQDVEQAADAIMRFFNGSAAEREALRQAAIETARQFPFARTVDKTLAVYEEIMREKDGTA